MASRRMVGTGALWTMVALVAGCVSDPGAGRSLGRTDYGSGSFALENSNREQGILRIGDSLRMYAAPGDLDLRPGHKYHFAVTNVSNDTTVSEGDVTTRDDGSLPPTTLAHDIGDMPGTSESEGDSLKVDIWDVDSADDHLEAFIPLLRVPALQGGWNIQEVEPPHVFATDASRAPTNAFAVSDTGETDPGEIPGPIFVGGDGLPYDGAGDYVDVYVMRDHDTWQGFEIPQVGNADHVVGPIQVAVNDDGTLVSTLVWEPTVNDVGIYDILVDVDQNGVFDWDISNKDGADGEAKVGITIQHSQAWVRARRIRHIIMNIAFNDSDRDGQWQNDFLGTDELYMYVNPDVTTRPDLNHKWVWKWIVRHQDFEEFWNNPANEGPDGCVDFTQNILGNFDVPAQHGCTNSAPILAGRADNIAGQNNGPGEFDVVFTFNTDGNVPNASYCPGRDILDIVSSDTTETLVQDIGDVPLEDRVGFRVQ